MGHYTGFCVVGGEQDYIGGIRKAYEKDWESSDLRKRQMAVALYFIDKLALRAGHEKDEDEADTVGCCTLKVRLWWLLSIVAKADACAKHCGTAWHVDLLG